MTCNKAYIFRGSKQYDAKQVQDILGIGVGARMPVPQPGQPGPPLPTSSPAGRFLMPVSEAEFHITSILEALTKDPWPVANDKRALRCTGVALGVAVGMLEVRISPLQPNTYLIANIDRFPQYWRSYHAICRWSMYRGPRYGSEQRAS